MAREEKLSVSEALTRLREQAASRTPEQMADDRAKAAQRNAEKLVSEAREIETKAGEEAVREATEAAEEKAEATKKEAEKPPCDLEIRGERRIGGEAEVRIRGRAGFIDLGQLSPFLSEVKFVFGHYLEVNPETNAVTIPIEGEIRLPFLLREAVRAAKKGETRPVTRWKRGGKDQENIPFKVSEKTWEGKAIEDEMKERKRLAAVVEKVRGEFGQTDFAVLREEYRKAEMAHSLARRRAERAIDRLMIGESFDKAGRFEGMAGVFYTATGHSIYDEVGGERVFNREMAGRLFQENKNLVFPYDEKGNLILLGERPSERTNFKAELWENSQTVRDWRLIRNVIRADDTNKLTKVAPDFARTFGKGALFTVGGGLLTAGELVGRGLHWVFRGLLRNPLEGVLAGLAEKYGVKKLGLPKIKSLKEKEKERREWMKEETEKRIRKQ